MNNLVDRVESAIKVFLGSDDFVVKEVLKKDHLTKLLVVTGIEDNLKLNDSGKKTQTNSFISILTSCVNELTKDEGIDNEIQIETEVVYERRK